MNTMPWFRIYSGDILYDRKIARVCKKTGQSHALVLGIWITILALANESPNRGELLISEGIPYAIDDLEDLTELPCEVLSQILDEFRSHGMISGEIVISVSNWDKRQFKSDNSAARVKKHREKQLNETLQKRYSNVIDSDSDSDTDSDKDKESETSNKKDDAATVFRAYSNEIGSLSSIIAEKIKLELEDTPAEWILDAISEAALHNSRSWAYVKAILKNWHANGRGKGVRDKQQSAERDVVQVPEDFRR